MNPSHTSTPEVPLSIDGNRNLDSSHKASDRPYAAWLLFFCVFIIIFRQTVLIRQRATTVDLSAVDTFAGMDITAVFLTALVLICSGRFFRAVSSIRRTPAVWLCGYYLVCAASFLWSSAPIYSLYRALEYFVLFFATIAAIGQYQDFEGAERAFLRVAAAAILLQMCVYPRLLGFSFSLWMWHTNTYSASSAILFCYCLGEYLALTKAERSQSKARARRLWLFGIFSFVTLALGTSSASNIAAAVGCLLTLLVLGRFGLMLAGLFILLFALLLTGDKAILRDLLFPGKDAYDLETASGRIVLWEYLWQKFLQRPILGYGFGLLTGGRDPTLGVGNAHNSFFTVLTGTGLVGLFMFSLFSVRVWWDALSKVWRRGAGRVGFAGALAAAFVNCLGMPLMADRWNTTNFVFVCLLGLFLVHVRGSRQVADASGRVMTAENSTS